jgi:hypothetical protein
MKADEAADLLKDYSQSYPDKHLNEDFIVHHTNAVVQPRTVMIEQLHAAVALLAVLGVLKDMCFAYVTEILILMNVEPGYIIAFELSFSL